MDEEVTIDHCQLVWRILYLIQPYLCVDEEVTMLCSCAAIHDAQLCAEHHGRDGGARAQ